MSSLTKGLVDLLDADGFDKTNINIEELEQQFLKNRPQDTSTIDDKLFAEASSLGIPLANLRMTPKENTNSTAGISSPIRSTPIRDTPKPMEQPIKSYYSVPSFTEATEEEMHRERITEVLNEVKQTNVAPHVSFMEERKRDEIVDMLVEIDELRESLEAAGVNIDNIPKVVMSSPYDEILTTRDLLRTTNNRNKSAAITTEAIMLGVYAIEHVFNGQRKIFGYDGIDMRGWSDHAQVKLRRLHPELASLTSNIVQQQNVSPFWKILLELVPSAILYSKSKKDTLNYHNPNDNPADDAELTLATQRLRTMREQAKH